MAIFICIKCEHVREVSREHLGKSVKCPKCGEVKPIYDTASFLKTFIKTYSAQNEQLKKLQQESAGDEPKNIVENSAFEELDIHNTDILTKESNLDPVCAWFKQHNIKADIDKDAVDTTGFFDEIALSLGSHYAVLHTVSDQIKYIQSKDYETVKIVLDSTNAIKQIESFCQKLYDYSFVARYTYLKKDKIIYLKLSQSPKIKAFFNGIWMEWFVLVKLLEFFRTRKIAPACARNINISFDKGISRELDLFLLTEQGMPICIECKSGEFRQDINKYSLLRKRLKLDKSQFIICAFGLTQEHAQGMTSMYDLTFVNEASLMQHIEAIV